jgi:hypothetical protein
MSIDLDTFLTSSYVYVDEWCKSRPARRRRGRPTALTRSEVVTLALCGQWARFLSERDFYRFADRRLRGAFPRLPDRARLNRRIRAEYDLIVAVGQQVATERGADEAEYEVLDATAAPVRNAKRGGWGWLPEDVTRGWSTRLQWYAGFHLLVAATPDGVITGYGIGPANAKDQPLAGTFFEARAAHDPRLPTVGQATGEPYLADAGFIGADRHEYWQEDLGARVICPPYRSSKQNWPRPLRRWLSSHRQLIETVNDRLLHTFRLERERPPELGGFHARLAAKVAPHTFCRWFNRQLGRPLLAFADLPGW